MENQQYCLKWNNFSQHLKYAFNTIWSNDDSFTDVTLAIQGGFKMRGHKMVLSACSYYFKKLLVADTSESPVLILHDVSRAELEALVHFMYHGEVNVTQEVIPGLLKAAEMLQIRGLCAAPPPSANKQSSASTTSTPTSTASRPLKRIAPAPPASEPPTASPAAKKARKKAPPSAPPPLAPAPADGRGRSSVESEESRDTNGVGGGSDTEGDGQLRIDEESNGLEPETLLDEQEAEGDGWSQGSGATEDQLLYPLPRPEPDADAAPSPEGFTFSSQLRNLAVKVKLEPRVPNDLEAAIVSSMPKNDGAGRGDVDDGGGGGGAGEVEAMLEEQRLLAFHEPRPCPHCRRIYRDAATLRTHVAIMHSEVVDPLSCGCGATFRTKHEMYVHKKNGHQNS
ncbi:protein bric-a-brac 1-like isoform X2 [Amphibalanus amphitrite]|uniref:protein bric-a-brac 1-like isoform X2 n=1 Tax=Amphibalanus amphitrite TaxID=1232801 RepID=UPI001C90C115|nr:protein bric-a-brac 1-like isoform X2 [Amphibalanus amphitrite]XP_043206184.1 protein bric-a-brac 1-like isoform X2 [Amphibalanus amphitrite]